MAISCCQLATFSIGLARVRFNSTLDDKDAPSLYSVSWLVDLNSIEDSLFSLTSFLKFEEVEGAVL